MRADRQAKTTFLGVTGRCAGRAAFLGFASAKELSELSFAEVLDESSGKGYQRPVNRSHSLDFRRYVQRPGSTTIPLTFNLRLPNEGIWTIEKRAAGAAKLIIYDPHRPLSQVDCQHRLGCLTDVDIPLAFMCLLGLSVEEERDVFTTINSKARGLNPSLIAFNESQLSQDLENEAPDLYMAIRLADDSDSPWFNRLSKGGMPTIGMKRSASLRMIRLAARRYLAEAAPPRLQPMSAEVDTVKQFWLAVTEVFPKAWSQPRKHLLTKGVGIYSLMSLAGQIVKQARERGRAADRLYFTTLLSDTLTTFDWSSEGPLGAYGGTKGAQRALELLETQINLLQQLENKCPTKTFS